MRPDLHKLGDGSEGPVRTQHPFLPFSLVLVALTGSSSARRCWKLALAVDNQGN